MFRHHVLPRSLLLACAIGMSVSVVAQPFPIYQEFELQARSNLLVNDNGFNLPPGSSFNSITPTINDDRWVAFPVQVVAHEGNPSQFGTGIWHGRNAIGGIVHRHDGGAEISPEIAINSFGEVVYRLRPGPSNHQAWLYSPTLGSVAQISTLPLTPTIISNLSLSNDGVIGYQGQAGNGRYFASTVVFASPPDSVVHVYDRELDANSPYDYLYSPTMNGHRIIAGKVHVEDDDTKNEIRLFHSDGTSELVAATQNLDPDSPYIRFDNSLDINDANVIAVVVRLAEGNARAVYRIGNGEAVEIARVGVGPITDIQFFRPAINDSGLVAFRASDAQGQAVYVGDGEKLVRVIGRGDRIETDRGLAQIGQHDNSAVFGGAPGLNNFGDVVVAAGLHPDGNNQIEWGSGIITAWALHVDPGEPELGLAPDSFAFTVAVDGQADDVLTVANVGMGELAWRIDTSASCEAGASADWLAVVGEGVLGDGEETAVTVAVDATGLAEGSHETAFCVDAEHVGGFYQTSVTVPVTLIVEPDLSNDCIFRSGFEEDDGGCPSP